MSLERKRAIVPVDIDLIERHRAYEDPQGRIAEEFLRPMIGGARTVAVLSQPLVTHADLGFVMCPSFGAEHTQLNALEVVVARAMAAAGFPVLRYQSQGYADSEGPRDAICPATHLTDAADAVAVLSERLDGVPVATVGGLFGGMVAALTAQRLDLAAVAMWEPAIDGTRYAERMLRNLALQEMAAARNQDRPRPPLTVLREQLAEGSLDAQGFLFTKRAYDELASMSLLRDLRTFEGASLVLGVSRSGRPSAAVTALYEQLARIGWNVTLRTIGDKLVRPLGTYRFVGFNDRPGRLDTQFALNTEIASATVSWARDVLASLGKAS
jgi:pimeloyl-ACP methyl ester carboxylesterase